MKTGDTDAFTILEELEQIDEKLDKQDMPLVKISDEGATGAFGVEQMPSLVYFENGVPELYPGDLLNDEAILKWMLSELKQEEIKELTVPMLDKLVERGHTMAVLFYDPKDKQDLMILDGLEKIDDDCRRFDIDFIKVCNHYFSKNLFQPICPISILFLKKFESMFYFYFFAPTRFVMPKKPRNMVWIVFQDCYILKIKFHLCMMVI